MKTKIYLPLCLMALPLLLGCATLARGIGGPSAFESKPQAESSTGTCPDWAPWDGAMLRYDPARKCWWASSYPAKPKAQTSSGMRLNEAKTAILFPVAGVEDGEAAWMDRGGELAVACSDTVQYLPGWAVRRLLYQDELLRFKQYERRSGR